MAKTYIRVGTNGYVSSTANEDVLTALKNANNIGENESATSLEFLPKTDCVVEINGYTSTVTAGELHKVVISDINGGSIKTFVTVTDNIEFVLNATF